MYCEGNNGGDILEIEPTDDGRVRLTVGHCCVVDIDCIVPVEFITLALSTAARTEGGIQGFLQNSGWPQEFVDRLVAQVERA